MKKVIIVSVALVCSLVSFAAKPTQAEILYDSLKIVNNELKVQIASIAEQNAQLTAQTQQLTEAVSQLISQQATATQQMHNSALELLLAADKLAAVSDTLIASTPKQAEYGSEITQCGGVIKVMTVKYGEKFKVPEGKVWELLGMRVVNPKDEYSHPRFTLDLDGKQINTPLSHPSDGSYSSSKWNASFFLNNGYELCCIVDDEKRTSETYFNIVYIEWDK